MKKDPLDEIFVDDIEKFKAEMKERKRKEKPILDKLKEDVDEQNQKVKLAKEEYIVARELESIKKKEYNISKIAKSRKYRGYAEARKLLITKKNRLSAKPSQIRRWTKDNLGKVLNNLFGDEG